MLQEWLRNIKNMGIFLICAQMLIHFRPNGSYTKYFRLLVGIMLLVQLMEPIGTFLGIMEEGQFQESILKMERKLAQIRELPIDLEKNTEDIWDILLNDLKEE